MEQTIERHRLWRLQYRSDRYMRDLSNNELATRAGDLMTVTLGHSKEGKISLGPAIEDPFKIERFTHVLEELVLRGISHRQPEILETMQIPKPSRKARRALGVLARRSWPERILVKFGERRHMATLFLEGKGRMSLASIYNDVSLGRARADDESQISAYLHPQDAHRVMGIEKLPGGGSRAVPVRVPYLGSVRVDLNAKSDFYVYCMAQACDARMFEDFSTDTSDVNTCVVIKRPEDFKERLKSAIAKHIPTWLAVDGSVGYTDPFFSRVHHLVPQFCKHFKFEYQKEYRMLWFDPNAAKPDRPSAPEHIYFDVGPLTDCAELIWL